MKYILLMLFSFSVLATEGHDYVPPVKNVINQYDVVNNYLAERCTGAASAIGGNMIAKSFATDLIQAGAGFGNADGCNAINIGLSQVYKNTLYSFGVSEEWGKKDINGKDEHINTLGIGINTRF